MPKVDEAKYRAIVGKKSLFQDLKWEQQDNNPKHTARAKHASMLLFKSKHNHMLKWPNQSPAKST